MSRLRVGFWIVVVCILGQGEVEVMKCQCELGVNKRDVAWLKDSGDSRGICDH